MRRILLYKGITQRRQRSNVYKQWEEGDYWRFELGCEKGQTFSHLGQGVFEGHVQCWAGYGVLKIWGCLQFSSAHIVG